MLKLTRLLNVILLLALASCSGSGELKNVPEKVTATFKAMYPLAAKTGWSSRGDSAIQATFHTSGNKFNAIFSMDGKWIETERSLRESDLPLTVMQTLKNGFNDYNIQSVAIKESPSGSGYRVIVANAMGSLQLELSKDGVILEKKAISDDDDDD